MFKRSFFTFVALLVVLSLALAACQPKPTEAPTQPPAQQEPTKAPEQPTATTAPEQPAAPAFEGMKVEAPNCDYGGELKSIEAVDAQTVKFTLCYPDPAFPSKVAFNVFAIVDSEYLAQVGGDSIKMSDAPVGTGPFKLKSWVRGDSITFEANPDYWGEKPKYQTLIFRWSEQSAQRLLELQSGQVDGIDNPAPEDFATIEADSNLQLIPRDPLNIFYIGFNVDLAPFNNEKVRQAFAMAIDRKKIVDNYYPEGSEVATVFVPPALKPGWSDANPWYEYNPEMAKQLLTEAGFDFNQEVKLSFRNVVRGYLPTPDKVAQEIQAQLAEIGVKVKLNQMESAAFIDSTAAGNEAFYLLGWGADYPDATNFYDYHFANDNNKQFGTLFPDIVEPIRKAAQISDPAERQKLYDEVNAKLKEHVPMIPVAHGASAVAFTASVKNAMTGPLSNEPFFIMDPGKDTLVWMQNGEPAAIYCPDETDGEALRACQQIFETLLLFKPGTAEAGPGLAESYTVNGDATEYVFTLRKGVKFHNGADLDANDVVASFKAQWDAKDPNHKGRTGTFEYFGAFFGAFLNAE
ncbi:ABC transporter substrate-binding protein [Anaerolinea thermophila]|uniref:ABC transporter substrate-binding protein n=1 Tax=Anaerolinea thermophila TaxID=167964 RepID=UPI00030A632C|nr:ABC transporter substrate-binding protein [Anaerolinea thermophila]